MRSVVRLVVRLQTWTAERSEEVAASAELLFLGARPGEEAAARILVARKVQDPRVLVVE